MLMSCVRLLLSLYPTGAAGMRVYPEIYLKGLHKSVKITMFYLLQMKLPQGLAEQVRCLPVARLISALIL